MLTRLRIHNFKKLRLADIELGKSVVLIGPNNSGKTTALQALALWDIGLRRWVEKRSGKESPEKRPGVALNRKDMLAIPVPTVRLLWRNLVTHPKERPSANEVGKPITRPRRIEIVVDGIRDGKTWSCGIGFDFANDESVRCRLLRQEDEAMLAEPLDIAAGAGKVQTAFLPPMSGLVDREFSKQPGEVAFLIGQGQTAQVLRNLCFQIWQDERRKDRWSKIVLSMKALFGVELQPPAFIPERGEITMSYKDGEVELDLASSGRGLQQTLLLLAYMEANPGAVLLLDEPDAHLEILRQKQIYNVLTETADVSGSQIIAASHSEEIMREAADRDVVIAFVGPPHRVDDRGSQVAKALKQIGFDQYYLAEQSGWVLYLEGATDLAILQAFADKLDHEARRWLERPFVQYVGNQISKAQEHFHGLREAKPDLAGLIILDRQETPPVVAGGLALNLWRRREIENYLCMEEVLHAYAGHEERDDLFSMRDNEKRAMAMKRAIEKVTSAVKTLRRLDPWSPDLKVSDEFLAPLFDEYFDLLQIPNLMQKTDYHVLAKLVPTDKIDAEVSEKLDAIVACAKIATPIRSDD